jgi:uncharacterized phage protein (TIGR01671 family)
MIRGKRFRLYNQNTGKMISHEEAMKMSSLALDAELSDSGLLVLPLEDKHIVIMCSIGRLDNNNNEIFEGDIIETSDGLKRDSTGGFSEDKYFWCYHSVDYLYGRLMPTNGRVVGNKFTDQDLFSKIANKETGETQ